MEFQIEQRSFQDRTGWWRWEVWLDGTDEDLDEVEYVEYVLHPSFPNPIQRVADRQSRFRLKASGWGQFVIYVHVFTKDGSTLKLEHMLTLEPSHGANRAATRGERVQLKVYLSCATVDSPFANALRDALEELGLDVWQYWNLTTDQPLETAIEIELKQSDAALFLISEVKSPYIRSEIAITRDFGIPRFAVLIGSHQEPPKELDDIESYRVEKASGDDAQPVAEWVAGQIKSD